MTLSFSTHINGQPTRFVEKIWRGFYREFFDSYAQEHYEYSKKMWAKFNRPILVSVIENPKIHTIREDKSNRWKTGSKIHFVIKNRTPDRFQFAPVIPCISTQRIEIKPTFKQVSILLPYDHLMDLSKEEISELAINDGFECVEDFWDYFSEDFTGKIIHWTDHQYAASA